MGYLFLIISRFFTITKVLAMKKCGQVAKGTKNGLKINALRTLICLAVSLVMLLITFSIKLDFYGSIISILSGIFTAMFLIVWLLSSQKVSLTLIEAFVMIGSVFVPILLAPVLYKGDNATIWQWIGSVLLVGVVFILASNEKINVKPSSILLLLLCLISSAGTVVTQKLFYTYSISSVEMFNFLSYLVALICFGIAIAILSIMDKRKAKLLSSVNLQEKKQKTNLTKRTLLFITIAAIALYGNQYFSTLAFGKLPSAIGYPLSSALGFILTLVSDAIFFKVRITLKSVIGLILAIISIILIVF